MTEGDRRSVASASDHEAVATCVGGLADELVLLRQGLHRHPEPSWEEHQTTAALMAVLRRAGLDPQVADPGTGVMCDIGTDGPLVAIRGDIDALYVPDTKSVSYRSQVPGVCHACGHDVHAAAVVGAGFAFAEHFRTTGRPGRVRLILQPAEEAVPGGAIALVDAGVMADVAAIFALHCDPSLDVGRIGLSEGPISSAADQLEIRLKGSGGHTGRPHRTADLVHIAGRVVVDLPMSLGRLSDPRDGVNLTFGSIHAGDAANVIPTEARILGSLRASGRSSWEAAPALLPNLLAAIVEPLGATWELDHRSGAPPIENDPWAVRMVERAARAALERGAVAPTQQSGGGEDFSWYLDHAPGAYLRLGVRAPGAAVVDIHSGGFDVDERCIALGARLLAGAALEALTDLG